MSTPATDIALAVETTSRFGQVALFNGEQVIGRANFPQGPGQSQRLLPTVADLMRTHALKPADLQRLDVSVGPGSFTGTRVGVTFAKTLALATGLRVVAVPTAHVVAMNAFEGVSGDAAPKADVLVVFDARRGKIWCALYEADAGVLGCRLKDAIGLATPEEALARCDRPVRILGEGAAYHAEKLTGDGVIRLGEDRCWPKVDCVARIGRFRSDNGDFADPAALVPTYVRRPEAEEKRLAAEKSSRS
ncbi:MAG: tRNA (adenosine(37)-N6)-threonylcarbamoyltransferase complex dimerization subunit type 1 TsaB [Planctomycetota bacterium]